MENNQNVKKASQVIAVILIILLLFGVVGVILKFTNGGTDDFKTFYVEQDGKMFATTDNAKLTKGSTARFDVKYTFDMLSDEPRDFSVKVVSSAPEGGLNYKVDGANCVYADGEDFTKAFAVEKNVEEGYFTIQIPTTLYEVLEKQYAGKTVELATEPDLSETAYFKLLVTSYNEASTITLSLYLTNPAVGSVEVDRDSIVFGGVSDSQSGDPPETYTITYEVIPVRGSGQDYSGMVKFECVSYAKSGETVTFSYSTSNSIFEPIALYGTSSGFIEYLTDVEPESSGTLSFVMPSEDVYVQFAGLY